MSRGELKSTTLNPTDLILKADEGTRMTKADHERCSI
jgi:hypothetical protein